MKSSIHLKTLTPLLAILLIAIAPAAYAEVITVTVTTDKPSYALGEMVTITGTVTEDDTPKADEWVNIEVRDPAGTLRWADVVKTDAEGAYTSSFRLAEILPTGTYTVKAVALGVTGTTSFEVTAVPTFTIAVDPETVIVPVEWWAVATVKLRALAGYNYRVALTYTAPTGIEAAFTTPEAIPEFESIIVLSATAEAVPGTYTVTITGTGEDGTVKNVNLTVAVIETPPALATLSERITALATEIAVVSTKIDNLAAKADELSTAIDTLSGDVAGLSTKLDELSATLDGVKADVAGLSDDIADLAATVDAKAAELSRNIAELRTAIEALDSSVRALSGKLGELSADLTAAIEAVETTLTADIGDVKTTVEGLGAKVDELAGTAEATHSAVGGLSTAVYAAAILALIAAVASIYAVIVVTRRLA